MDNDCPNCISSIPHTDMSPVCMLWALLTVEGEAAGWTLEEMHERMRRVDSGALWEALGPICDSLAAGEFDTVDI